MESWEGKEMLKDTSDMYLVNLIAACALQSCRLDFNLLYTCPAVGLPAQDVLLCSCWKNNKLNMWSLSAFSCLISLFAFWVFHLTFLCTYCAFLYFGRVCEVQEHKHKGGALWWQNMAGGKTVLTLSLRPHWLPLRFPHTHMLWQRNHCHSDTPNTLSLFLTGWKHKE